MITDAGVSVVLSGRSISCMEPATASQQPTIITSRKTAAALMAYLESETNSERSSRPATLTTTVSVT